MAKDYVKGSAREITFSNGGSILNLSILKSDLDRIETDAKGYMRLCVAARRQEDDYGNTHYIYVDPYKPDAKGKGAAKPKSKPFKDEQDEEDDLPF